MSKEKFIYRFSEGGADMRDLLGGKGANLSEMARLGLPVPPGFVITTEACRQYYSGGNKLPDGLWEDVQAHVREVETAAAHVFGSPENPLLVSVRSGSKFSMPGMMDTVLNLGLNDETRGGLAQLSGSEHFALDSHRRFLQLFSKVVLGVPGEEFEDALTEAKQRRGVSSDAELDVEELQRLIAEFRHIIRENSRDGSFDNPWQQLRLAIEAVLNSWNNHRAIAYREYRGIPHHLGTAVTVQAMAFGNLGWDSATGVTFSRDPSTGANILFGDYLPNAQGEDVVSGVRTPKPIAEMAADFPEAHAQLSEIARRLESHYRDLQDIEFTIEKKRLYILQTRNAQRTAAAAVRVAVDMVEEGLIAKEEAVMRVPAADLSQLLLPRFAEDAKQRALAEGRLLGTGLHASPGAATGKVAFDADTAIQMANKGAVVILVRPETAADDVPGILRAAAVLTARGGMTSHAAVVTRGLGKPAVVGCEGLHVDPRGRRLTSDSSTVNEGDQISVDGFSGEVFLGAIETIEPDVSSNHELAKLLSWADEARRMRIRANADTELDAETAIRNGAEGIGLCRTEHMFFSPERLPYVRQFLLSAQASFDARQEVEDLYHLAQEEHTDKARKRAADATVGLQANAQWQAYHESLARLLEFQREDFTAILSVMHGKPVVIRLLDAPLHEFLGQSRESLLQETAVLRATAASSAELAEKEQMLAAAELLHESNPMLGHRGCRLGLTHPEMYEMQVRAVAEATATLHKRGIDAHPEVMIPLVADPAELTALLGRLQETVNTVSRETGRDIAIRFGTMIEVPRAALIAAELAPQVAFFSFGSNDLTQMTYGFSRDDAEEKFLRFYVQRGLLPANPFETLDRKGVGRLISIAAEEGRQAKPDLELGICGEHGGDPASVIFCHEAGLHYVSCSPHRIPIARLAAAQAALGEREREV